MNCCKFVLLCWMSHRGGKAEEHNNKLKVQREVGSVCFSPQSVQDGWMISPVCCFKLVKSSETVKPTRMKSLKLLTESREAGRFGDSARWCHRVLKTWTLLRVCLVSLSTDRHLTRDYLMSSSNSTRLGFKGG